MKQNIILVTVLCALLSLANISFAQVTVQLSAPINGATVTSPVPVKASATSSHTITGWRIYLDGVSVYRNGSTPSISTSVSMSTGTHKLTVRAWASNGSYGSANVSVTAGQMASAVAVAISPTAATVQIGLTQQFSAAVTGSTNTSVAWSVNGIQAGNSTVGTISSTGLYTTPAAVPSGGSVTVRATSVADSTKSASAGVTLVAAAAPIAVTISPTSATVQSGATQQFTGTVTGTSNTSVSWLVNGAAGGNSTVGTISSTGLYLAPAVVPSTGPVTVTARSVYDSTRSANAVVTVSASSTPVAVAISPTSTSLQSSQTQQFTATITGTQNTSALWYVNNIQGGNSTVGTISSAGLYAAPTVVPSGGSVAVKAQSAFDNTKSASAAVTITTAPGVNYYISTSGSDSNACTAASPCATINSVNSRLGGSLPLGSGGTTIHVAAGSYTGPIVINKSGTSSARIRYISDTRWGARIATGSATESFKNYGNYVDIVGFDITGGGPFGIANQGSYGRVMGNRVHDIGVSLGCVSGAGILSDALNYQTNTMPSHNDIIGNWVYNVGNVNAPCNQIHGIYVASPYGNVMNNVSFRNAGWGVHLWHGASNMVIANNTVFRNGEGGMIIGCGDNGCTINDYTTVVNNIVMDSVTGYGIIEHGVTGTHNVYANNLAYSNPSGSFYLQNSLTCSNCMTTNPLLVNYQSSGGGDYHLSLGSPAIDKGTSSKAPANDFEGGARPMNYLWDIGAYEYSTTPASWPWL